MNEQRLEKIKNVTLRRQTDVTIVLENITDLHNMGAVLRTCDAVGIAEIYMIYSQEHYRPNRFKVGKNTSGGARKWVDVKLYFDYDRAMQEIKDKYQTILAMQLGDQSHSIYDRDFTKPGALLFGNEKFGLSQKALSYADQLVHIPQMGMVQSLNISVACAVSAYEMLRQRMRAGYYHMDAENKGKLYAEYLRRSKEKHSGEQVIFADAAPDLMDSL